MALEGLTLSLGLAWGMNEGVQIPAWEDGEGKMVSKSRGGQRRNHHGGSMVKERAERVSLTKLGLDYSLILGFLLHLTSPLHGGISGFDSASPLSLFSWWDYPRLRRMTPYCSPFLNPALQAVSGFILFISRMIHFP